jgi:hypothetical protein
MMRGTDKGLDLLNFHWDLDLESQRLRLRNVTPVAGSGSLQIGTAQQPRLASLAPRLRVRHRSLLDWAKTTGWRDLSD